MCRSQGGSTEATEPLCQGRFSLATFTFDNFVIKNTRKILLQLTTFVCLFFITNVYIGHLFLQVQGLIISQMLRKSVETRDWVNTIEPRNVRAVMKRVVEDTTSIDVQVNTLYNHNVIIFK